MPSQLVISHIENFPTTFLGPCPSVSAQISEHSGGAFHAYKKGLANTIRSRFCALPDVRDPIDVNDPLELYRTVQALRDRSRQLETINTQLIEELASAIHINQNLSEKLQRLK